MPSRQSYEQVMTWLNSKAADRDSLDGINAQLVINVINEYRKELNGKGIIIRRLKERMGDRGIFTSYYGVTSIINEKENEKWTKS